MDEDLLFVKKHRKESWSRDSGSLDIDGRCCPSVKFAFPGTNSSQWLIDVG